MLGILNREGEALEASLAGSEDSWRRVSVLRKRTDSCPAGPDERESSINIF